MKATQSSPRIWPWLLRRGWVMEEQGRPSSHASHVLLRFGLNQPPLYPLLKNDPETHTNLDLNGASIIWLSPDSPDHFRGSTPCLGINNPIRIGINAQFYIKCWLQAASIIWLSSDGPAAGNSPAEGTVAGVCWGVSGGARTHGGFDFNS